MIADNFFHKLEKYNLKKNALASDKVLALDGFCIDEF